MSDTDKAIIFCGKKARADDLSSEISLSGIAVQCIHGDRDQVCEIFLSFQVILIVNKGYLAEKDFLNNPF